MRMITMECSEDLNRRIQRAFEEPDFPSNECYRYVSFNWIGDCPVNDNGLCALHREKGEGYLPKTCRLYPRSLKKVNGQLCACCSSSCEKVVEMLYEPDGFTLEEIELDEKPNVSYEIDGNAIEELSKFTVLLQDRSTSLAASIKDICLIINQEEFNKDETSDSDPLDETLTLFSRLVRNDTYLSEIVKPIIERYKKDRDLYFKDRDRFEKHFEGWMPFFENVINNSMFYENFPFVDKRFDRTNAYKGLCVTYGILRIATIGHTAINGYTKDNLVDATAAIFHLIDHTSFYYNVSIVINGAAKFITL